MDIKMKMTPELTGPGPIDPDPVEAGPGWWDGFAGVKTHSEISANWDFDFYGTVGAEHPTSPGPFRRCSLDATFYGFLIGYEFN